VSVIRVTIEIDDEELRQVLTPLTRPGDTDSVMPDDGPRLLTVREVGEHLRLSRSKVYQLLATGRISSVLIGRSRRILETAVVDFVAEAMPPRRPSPAMSGGLALQQRPRKTAINGGTGRHSANTNRDF